MKLKSFSFGLAILAGFAISISLGQTAAPKAAPKAKAAAKAVPIAGGFGH